MFAKWHLRLLCAKRRCCLVLLSLLTVAVSIWWGETDSFLTTLANYCICSKSICALKKIIYLIHHVAFETQYGEISFTFVFVNEFVFKLKCLLYGISKVLCLTKADKVDKQLLQLQISMKNNEQVYFLIITTIHFKLCTFLIKVYKKQRIFNE